MTRTPDTDADEVQARDTVALAVVGAGRMGGAVIHGALRSGELRPEDLGVFHPEPARRQALASHFGIAPLDDAGVHRAERVLIAVKPQSFERVAPLIARRQGQRTADRPYADGAAPDYCRLDRCFLRQAD